MGISYNIKQKKVGDKILIQWDGFTDALRYELQFFQDSSWITIDNNITNTWYVYTLEHTNPTAQFRVKSINNSGESEWLTGETFEVTNQSTIDSEIVIAPQNRMRGYIDVIGCGETELEGSIVVKGYDNSNINSSLVIENKPKHNEIDGDIIVAQRDNNEIDGEIFLKPSARMRGYVDVVAPPKKISKILPIKDSVVRQSAPTINYGDSHQMLAGQTKEGKFISYLGFNLDLPDGVDIISAKIILNKQYETSKKFFIGLYETSNNWEEDEITWNYRPYNEQYINQAVIPLEPGLVEINITDFVLDWQKEDNPKSFIIRPRNYNFSDLVVFNTKESLDPPILEVEYYEPVENAGSYSFDGELTVRQKVERDFSASINVESDYNIDEVDGELELENKNNKAEIAGSIIVSNKKHAMVNGEIEIEKKPCEESKNASLIVPYTSSIDSEIELKRYDEIVEIDANIEVRAAKKNELDSNLTIKGKNKINDLDGSIVVGRDNGVNLDSELEIVLKNDKSDKDAFVIVRQAGDGNLDSSLDISLKENVTEKDAFITVRRIGIESIDSSLELPRYDVESEIDSNIYVLFRSNIDASIEIPKIDDQKDIDGFILLREKPCADYLESDMTVRVFWVDELDASLNIERRFEIGASINVIAGGDYVFIM